MGSLQAITKLKEVSCRDHSKNASLAVKKRKLIHFIAEQDGVCLPASESLAWAEALEAIATQIRKNLDLIAKESEKL